MCDIMGRLYVAQDRPLERELNSKDAKFGYEMGRGPRPLHRVADIVSKPRIWNHNTTAASLENQPTSRITGDREDWIQPTSTPQVLVPHKHPMCYVRIPKESGRDRERKIKGQKRIRLIAIDYHSATGTAGTRCRRSKSASWPESRTDPGGPSRDTGTEVLG